MIGRLIVRSEERRRTRRCEGNVGVSGTFVCEAQRRFVLDKRRCVRKDNSVRCGGVLGNGTDRTVVRVMMVFNSVQRRRDGRRKKQ